MDDGRTLAENLALVLIEPRRCELMVPVDVSSFDRAIAGALLLELAARGRIAADGDGAKARLNIVEHRSDGVELLEKALSPLLRGPLLPLPWWVPARLDPTAPGTRTQKAVEQLAPLRKDVMKKLATSGLVHRAVWLNTDPHDPWQKELKSFEPKNGGRVANELRDRVEAVLRGERKQPTPGDILLILLLHAMPHEMPIFGVAQKLRPCAAEITEALLANIGRTTSATLASVRAAVAASMTPREFLSRKDLAARRLRPVY